MISKPTSPSSPAAPIRSTPRRAPDKTGPRGSAWRRPPRSTALAQVDAWLVHLPGRHPIWEHWIVAVVHLRDLPGLPPAHRVAPGATHEVIFGAIDPTTCAHPDPDSVDDYPILQPMDVAEQLVELTDDQAREVLGSCVDLFVAGASPDQDYRTIWKAKLAQLALDARSKLAQA